MIENETLERKYITTFNPKKSTHEMIFEAGTRKPLFIKKED